MSEISRHLPLSQRPSEPEARVTGVWSAEIADVLDRTADLLDSLDADGWEAASMCEGWTVRDVAGHVVWRVGASNAAMVRTAVGSLRRRPHLNPMHVMDDLSADEAARSPRSSSPGSAPSPPTSAPGRAASASRSSSRWSCTPSTSRTR
ncbi:maleylpyruvate isomerase N-terminal domain-containing protein [Clavibacter tessellarius]|uniref:maleylpyruvate isomerase N-terminal domain-containing protein n=1 Tax=Clavibacter tessellarius TaxID=31965 RepID=UPI0032460CDC